MIVYSVWDDDEQTYFVTKAEAVAYARECARYTEFDYEVRRHAIGPITRKRAVAMLNGREWAMQSETVYVARGKGG